MSFINNVLSRGQAPYSNEWLSVSGPVLAVSILTIWYVNVALHQAVPLHAELATEIRACLAFNSKQQKSFGSLSSVICLNS